MPIRFVTFDALHTIITPRLPIYVQYSQTFEPYLGVLPPNAIKKSFKESLKQLQLYKPVYKHGAQSWWGEVIRRTAIGAGADPNDVDKNIEKIVPELMRRFSSDEGYQLFDDTIPCLQQLNALNIHTGVISNTDARMRSVLASLGVMPSIYPLLLSEEEMVEKPSKEIFLRACHLVNVKPEETVHVGDDLSADYGGAMSSGLHALLIRRTGPEGEGEAKEEEENLSRVPIVSNLREVVDWVKHQNNI